MDKNGQNLELGAIAIKMPNSTISSTFCFVFA